MKSIGMGYVIQCNANSNSALNFILTKYYLFLYLEEECCLS